MPSFSFSRLKSIKVLNHAEAHDAGVLDLARPLAGGDRRVVRGRAPAAISLLYAAASSATGSWSLAASSAEPAGAGAGCTTEATRRGVAIAGSGGTEHLTATDHELTGFVTHTGSFPFHW